MASERLNNELITTSKMLSHDCRALRQSADHDMTPHLAQELATVGSGADHIRLDNGFLKRSKTFADMYNPQKLANHANGSVNSMRNVYGEVLTAGDDTLTSRVKTLDSLSVDKRHQLTLGSIQQARKDLQPHIRDSVNRIEHFCDHSGVTDRHVSYKHNLNMGNRVPTTGYITSKPRNDTLTSLNTEVQCIPSVQSYNDKQRLVESAPQLSNRGQSLTSRRPALPERSIQERCGINTTYPGITEYKKRYSNDQKPEYFNYQVNPSPQFSRIGRPFMPYVPLRNKTEYTSRYGIPDGKSVNRFPWLRQ